MKPLGSWAKASVLAVAFGFLLSLQLLTKVVSVFEDRFGAGGIASGALGLATCLLIGASVALSWLAVLYVVGLERYGSRLFLGWFGLALGTFLLIVNTVEPVEIGVVLALITAPPLATGLTLSVRAAGVFVMARVRPSGPDRS